MTVRVLDRPGGRSGAAKKTDLAKEADVKKVTERSRAGEERGPIMTCNVRLPASA